MVKRNIIANTLGRGWSMLMGLVFVPLYIKFLGMEAYGLIGFFATLQMEQFMELSSECTTGHP
ncbi:MAG: hypothetical protein KGL31_00010 [candidate division NC10 bacterium]|nr:hypothetical protein [candidate division NC10 bacterium]MDE2320300.1 hypothetical protein [candidate division NC10 bacterium]